MPGTMLTLLMRYLSVSSTTLGRLCPQFTRERGSGRGTEANQRGCRTHRENGTPRLMHPFKLEGASEHVCLAPCGGGNHVCCTKNVIKAVFLVRPEVRVGRVVAKGIVPSAGILVCL